MTRWLPVHLPACAAETRERKMANGKGSAGLAALHGVRIIFGIGFIVLPLLPWAEIGLPTGAQVPPIVIGPFSVDVSVFHGLFDAANAQLPALVKKVQNDPNYQYYVYSFFLGVAMIAASI